MNFSLIELRHLRYFLAVAEGPHFTRAAEKLNITQPTLSHQIRALEDQIGLPLFDRIGRRVMLTAAGEMLLPHARRVFRELEEAQAALSELHGLRRGELKVGIVQTVNACVIPEIVARFSSAHPGIRVACSELPVAEIEAGIDAGRVDLGISFLPATNARIEGEKLFSEELVGVVASRHPLAARRQMRMAELAAHPLVLLSGRYCTRQLIDQAFAAAGAPPLVQIEMNSIESILATVREGGLVSVLPSIALCQRDSGLAAIRLTNPTPRRSVGLLWLQGAHRRVAAEAFARITEEVLRERRVTDRVSKEPLSAERKRSRRAAA